MGDVVYGIDFKAKRKLEPEALEDLAIHVFFQIEGHPHFYRFEDTAPSEHFPDKDPA